MAQILKQWNTFLWGPWMLAFMLGSGLFLHIRMGFLPIRNLSYALKCILGKDASKQEKGGISPLSSLTTELAATIGTGNMAGVAGAMVLGGPGALFWMILAALAGLSTKFAESMLSVRYRIRRENGEYAGGPMYTLSLAFPHRRLGKWLGTAFAVFAVAASFGMGNMTQSNSAAAAFEEAFGTTPEKTGFIMAVLVILAVVGGIKGISKVTLYLVPAMAIFYLCGALFVVFSHPQRILTGIAEIVRMALTPQAAAGGIGGAAAITMRDAMRWGISRGVFSNEAGLGAAGITAAAADTDSAVRQGYISMTGVFFDTIVICTLTGLVLSCSGVLGIRDENGMQMTGAALLIAAFSTVFGELGGAFVSIGIALFAFATIVAWEYQGECAFGFLVKEKKYCLGYRFFYGILTFFGAVCRLEVVWDFSDMMNAMMAVPNLICVLVLSGGVCREMKAYEKQRKR